MYTYMYIYIYIYIHIHMVALEHPPGYSPADSSPVSDCNPFELPATPEGLLTRFHLKIWRHPGHLPDCLCQRNI